MERGRAWWWTVAGLAFLPAFFLLGLVAGWGTPNPRWYTRAPYWLVIADAVVLVVVLGLAPVASWRERRRASGPGPDALPTRAATPAAPETTVAAPAPAEPDGLASDWPDPLSASSEPEGLAVSPPPDGRWQQPPR